MGADYKKQNASILGFNTGNLLIGAGVTTYFGQGDQGIVTRQRIVMPYDAILNNFYVEVSVPPGAGETIDLTVMVNGIASVLTIQIAGAVQQAGADLVNAVAVVAGDLICIRYVSSVAAANSSAGVGIMVRRI